MSPITPHGRRNIHVQGHCRQRTSKHSLRVFALCHCGGTAGDRHQVPEAHASTHTVPVGSASWPVKPQGCFSRGLGRPGRPGCLMSASRLPGLTPFPLIRQTMHTHVHMLGVFSVVPHAHPAVSPWSRPCLAGSRVAVQAACSQGAGIRAQDAAALPPPAWRRPGACTPGHDGCEGMHGCHLGSCSPVATGSVCIS